MTIIEQNKFLLTMQLTSLMSKQQSELIKKPYKIFSLDGSTFVISVNLIKTDTIWFDTYYVTSDNVKHFEKKHKVFGKQISYIADEIFLRLTSTEIENADNICLRETSKCKQVKKQDVIDQSVIRKRSESRQPVEHAEHITKPRPSNDFERRQAQFERKLFKDPKMWLFDWTPPKNKN